MVLTLLVTLVILAIGLTAMWLSSSGMKMSANLTRRQEALYAAEAGLEHARSVLAQTVSWSSLLTGCGSAKDDTGTNGRGVVLCESPTLPLADYPIVKWSTKTPLKVAGVKNITYTVFIRNDAAEAAATGNLYADLDQRVVVRSEGTGRDGLSFFAIEAVLSQAAATPEEENYSQLGGSAQNQNSQKGKMPLVPKPSSP